VLTIANTPDEARDMIKRLIGPAGPELSCDECFDLLDVYVELEQGGGDADAAMPAMRAYLIGCPACRDDHDSLRALLELVARAPPRPDLRLCAGRGCRRYSMESMSERARSPMRPQRQAWPVLSGSVPFVGESYIGRPETGQGPWDALHPGLLVILGPGGEPMAPAARCGGTGKTQLAAAFAVKLWAAGALDLLVWLDAGSRDSIVSGYARALADIRVAAPPGKPEAGAGRFLTWLADTGRRWLVVLDGLAEPADAEGLWPHGRSGEVVVTTRLAGLGPEPVTADGAQQLAIAVPAFSPREALSYISGRLNDDPFQAAGSLDLATAVECLPVGLALAVAYLHDSGQDCRQYRLARARYRLEWPDPLAPCWMLAVDRARQFAPAQLAWPALKLAAVLGPAWIPGAVLTSAAACAYVTGRRSVTLADQASLRGAFGNLQRLGLVTIEPDNEIHTVRMPAALQCSVRRAMTATELRQAVEAAADAVCESWPEGGAEADVADLERALRDCAISLRRCDDLALWSRGCHPLLVRVGQSLGDAQMAETALSHWRDLAERSAGHFGARNPLTLQFRERLASAAAAAGRTEEAIRLRGELIAEIDTLVGPNHPQAISSRASLAQDFRAAGRHTDAILLGERVASDSELVLGRTHPQTAESLSELGCAYFDVGRYPEAISAFQRCLAVREQTIGLMHAQTISARRQLAEAYRRADRASESITLYEDALVQLEEAVGTEHPDTVTAREKLAMARYDAGQLAMATVLLERAVAEWERVPGVGPADTIAARANLAAVYCLGGRLKEAIPLYESELADLERIRGAEHRDTLRARWKLAAAWHRAKRLSEAVQLGEATVADCERILGAGHWDTLTSRANLAHAYHGAGQLKQASAQFDRALRDCEQSIGPQDPLTDQVRALRKRHLAGRHGAAPIIAPPVRLRCAVTEGYAASRVRS
jgi:tetratricopeptide (TPR) repeat protein